MAGEMPSQSAFNTPYNRGGKATLSILDVDGYGDIRVKDYGVDRAWEQFDVFRAEHNKITASMFDHLLQGVTEDRLRRFGDVDTLTMERVEMEYGAPSVKAASMQPYEVGLPIFKLGVNQQWTKDAISLMSVGQFNKQLVAVLTADIRAMRTELGKALFRNTNYEFRDRYSSDGRILPVRALVNADTLPIPVGPMATTFDGSTHSHYGTAAAVNDASVKALVNNVMEHTTTGVPVIEVNIAQEAEMRALTGFTAAQDPRLMLGVNITHIQDKLDLWNQNDRFIGIIDSGAEVWVRPYIPANYLLCYVRGGELEKPLTQRRHMLHSSDLEVKESMTLHPSLQAREISRVTGFGVTGRTSAAILQKTGGSYTIPSIYA